MLVTRQKKKRGLITSSTPYRGIGDNLCCHLRVKAHVDDVSINFYS